MNTRMIVSATLVATLAACGATPDQNSALDQARSRLGTASGDPQVTTLASDELKRATESLDAAERAWRDGGAKATVDHLAYMTAQRVTIAQDTASSRASQAVTAGAAAERDKMRLGQRTQEADKAERKLAVSEQRNAQQSADLAAADATAQRDKARVERRDARVRDLEAQLKGIDARKTDRGMVLTLGDVLFDSGQARLLADGSRNMVKVADFFKRNPSNTASIEGYTDSVGSADANVNLSGRRADAVMAVLVGLGVPASHLTTKAHGESIPTASNATAVGRQMNRRVEIVFATSADEPGPN